MVRVISSLLLVVNLFVDKEFFTFKIILLVSFQEVDLLSHWTVHLLVASDVHVDHSSDPCFVKNVCPRVYNNNNNNNIVIIII